MMSLLRHAGAYRELIALLAWTNIIVRYKQAYLGIAWAVLKPVVLVVIFSIVRSFVGIDTGDVPYAVLTFAALMPWILFQESASEGIHSVVGNAPLIRKIYFPREVFPLTAVVTKLVEFLINAVVLAGLMAWYGFMPSLYALWIPVVVAYALVTALTISFAGSALNVYYRDVSAILPLALAMMMYVSPIIYPLELVKRTLLERQAAGEWSDFLFILYTANPLTGIIDAFQRVTLRDLPPDWGVILPGLLLVAIAFPFSYGYFKRAEAYFADIV